jgi:hypothetical protein
VSVLGQWLRRASLGLSVLVAALAIVTARAIVEGESALRQSNGAFDRGDLATATVDARRAATLYAPGAPHVGAAYARLRAIAIGAESSGDRATAMSAWRAIRGAALETRHLWIPRGVDLDDANQALARLQSGAVQDPSQAREIRDAALEHLRQDDAPRTRWVLVLGAGFVLSAFGLGLLGWRGFGRDGGFVFTEGRLALVLLAAGSACWTIAVYRA